MSDIKCSQFITRSRNRIVMPLIVICGFPSSGKSCVSSKLNEFLSKRGYNVFVVSDNVYDKPKNKVYFDSNEEKILRGNLKSEVQRSLCADNVVILDSANYIKGYRYELFCVAKSAQTTLTVIYCDASEEFCKERNNLRNERERYDDSVLQALIARFEPPNPQNRWDSPLFITRPDENLPLDEIHDALFKNKRLPPNQSTQSQPLAAKDYLHELDIKTQRIVAATLSAQKTAVIGDSIKVPGADEKLLLCKTFTLGELQRCKRQFISFTKSQVVNDTSKLGNMFVTFINQSVK